MANQIFTHVVANRCSPYVMVNAFTEGKQVRIAQEIGNGLVMITDGETDQICHVSQLRPLKN